MTQQALSHPNKLSQLVGGILKEVSVTKAVSATTNYSAGDVISESCTAGSTTVAGTPWTFAGMARANGGSGLIVKAHLLCQTLTTAQTHKTALFLFKATPTCMLSDNIANTALLHADEANYVGVIRFPALSRVGTGNSEAIAVPESLVWSSTGSLGISCNLPLAFTCAPGADDLIGILTTLDTASGEKAGHEYILKLTAQQY